MSLMLLLTAQMLMTLPKVGLSYSSNPVFNVQPTLYFVPRIDTYLSLQDRKKTRKKLLFCCGKNPNNILEKCEIYLQCMTVKTYKRVMSSVFSKT